MALDRRFPVSKVQAARRYLRWIRSESARFDELERLRARFPEARIEPGVHIVEPDRLTLEGDVVIQAGCHLHCGGRDWTNWQGSIHIGRSTVVAPHCVLWGGGGITIGRGVFFGPGAMVFSSAERFASDPEEDDLTHSFAPVVIGDEARLAAQAIMVPGTELEPRSMLGANSILMGKVPTGKLYVGSPAKERRDVRIRPTLN